MGGTVMHQKHCRLVFLIVLVLSMVSCDSEAQEQNEQFQPLNVQQLNKILKMKGTTQDGDYKIKIPQNDLNLTVGDVKIIPPMGATSWVAFTPAPEGARIFGDMVLKETEVGPVEKVLFDQDLHATALHKDFEGESPRVMFMHIGGKGSQESLARSVRAVLDKIESLRGGDPSKAPSAPVTNTLDTEAIVNIIGHKGSVTDGVFKIGVGRPNVDLEIHYGENHETNKEGSEEYEEHREEGKEEEHEESEEKEAGHIHVTSFTGFGTGIAFQGTPDNAAVAGDFAMLASEVPAVMQTLVNNGFKVVSLHNHMLYEHPRIFFLHFWGTGNAQELARDLRKALDQTKKTEQETEDDEDY